MFGSRCMLKVEILTIGFGVIRHQRGCSSCGAASPGLLQTRVLCAAPQVWSLSSDLFLLKIRPCVLPCCSFLKVGSLGLNKLPTSVVSSLDLVVLVGLAMRTAGVTAASLSLNQLLCPERARRFRPLLLNVAFDVVSFGLVFLDFSLYVCKGFLLGVVGT